MKNERNEKNIRLLIADDDQTLLDETHRALEGCGFRVHQAHNAQLAMVSLARQAFDLVVLDVKMACDDRINVFEHIRCVYPELPVVLLFSHNTFRAAFERPRVGVFAYLPKPCNVERLARIVRRAVKRPGATSRASSECAQPLLHLLVIDQDEALLQSLSAALSLRCICVTAAGSGSEAQRLLEQHDFDVVMMDFELADLSGIDLLRRIKQARSCAGVLFLTAHPSVSRTVEGMRAGANDVLVKPQDPDVLAFYIRRAAKSSSRSDQRVQADCLAG